MKQKELTKAQRVVLGRLNEVLAEAKEFKIGFVFDEDDCSLMAFNAENVNIAYCGRNQESDNDERINWDITDNVPEFSCDYFNSAFDNYYLNFIEV